MKFRKLFASALVAVAAITSVTSLTSCKKNTDDDVVDNEVQAKLEAAINALSVKATIEADFTLVTTAAGGVTISWASDNTDVIKIENGKAIVTRPGLTEADATVKLTATAVVDGETKSKEFTVTVPHVADEAKTIAEIKALDNGTITAVKGVVSGFVYAESDITVKSGFYITDNTDTIYVFGKNAAAELSEGDEIYFSAEKSAYYGAPQLQYPNDVVKLGTGKTPNYTNIITDKTIAELSVVPKPGDNETTNQGKVYELLTYFKKISTDTYVNYRVCDPYDEDKYMNIYFKSTIVPTETYDWTEEFDAHANKYCKVKFYMAGTSSSGAWRGHILDFVDLSEAEVNDIEATAAAAEEANRLTDLIESLYEQTSEINLTPSEGYTLTVTPQEGATTLAWNAENNKLTVTPGLNEATETLTIKVACGDVEFTKVVSISSKLFVVTEGNFTATMQYSGGTTNMVVNQNNASTVNLRSILFNVKTENGNPAVGLNKDGSIRLYKSNKLTISAQDLGEYKLLINKITITYGTGKDNYAFTVNSVTGSKDTAEYTINGSSVVIENTSSESAQLWIKKLVIDYTISAKTDLDKATEEANRLAALIGSTYAEDAEIALTPNTGYTVVVTPQANATALAWNAETNKLAINVGEEVVTETLTITVTYNGQTHTTTAISVEILGVIPTIEEVIDATLGKHITAGTVVAVTAQSFILKDDTGYILVYKGYNWTCDVTVGDVLTVNGTTSKYNNLVQFGNDTTYTKGTPVEVTHPTATDLDAAAIDTLLTATPEIKYVSYVGTLSVSNNKYYNVTIKGATAQGSISYPANTTELAALNGKKVKVTGYFVGISGSSTKYVNTALVSIEEEELTDLEKAEAEAKKLAALIASSYSADAEVTLTPTEGYTLEVTIQADATALSFADNKLTINVGTEVVTEKLKIKVTFNGQSFETEEISILVVGAIPTISQVIGAEVGTHVTQGTVVAINTKSFIIKDSTGYILVYLNATPDVEVGDVVKVSGTTSAYNNLVQFGSNITYTKTSTEEVTHPTPEVLDADDLTALLTATPEIKYVSYVGTLSISGSFYNVTVSGTTATGSLKYPTNTTELSALNGKPVTVTGYFIGISSGKYVDTAVTSVVEKVYTAEEKAEIEANRLAALIEDLYELEADVVLTPTEGYTLTVTPQTGATTLAWNAETKTLTVTPGATEVIETIDIKVQYNEAEYTKATVNVKSKLFTPVAGNFTTTMQYTTNVSGTQYMAVDANNAKTVELNPVLFNVSANAVGSYSQKIGLKYGEGIKLYAASGNGNELKIASQDLGSLKLIINKITITYGAGTNTPTFTINGEEGSKEITEYNINASSVVIKNTTTTAAQLWITKIEIDYTISEITDLDRAQAEANRLANLVSGKTFAAGEEVELSSTVGTVEVTLPADPKTLAWNAETKKLVVTPTVNEITEKITISVKVNEATETINNISITSVKEREEISVDTTYSFNSADATEKDNYYVVPAEASVEGSSINFEHLAIDATTGKLNDHGGTWFQFNNTTTIKFTVARAATIKLKMHEDKTTYTVNGVAADANHTFKVEAGEVTIASTENMYIGYIYITLEKETITADTTITFTTDGNYTTYSNYLDTSNITIVSRAEDAQVKDGSMKFKVANGAKVTFTSHFSCSYSITVNGTEIQSKVTDLTYVYSATEDSTIVYTPVDGGNNYLVSIAVAYDIAEPALVATFTFGTDDATKINENSQDGSTISTPTYSETSGDYTLTLNNLSKVNKNSYDASGNACLKLGIGSAVGSFSFTVSDDVKKVVIYVAGYKSSDAKISVNGGATQTISTHSSESSYTAVTIDTTKNKTVTFTTASGGYRCKINTIEFYA